MRGALGPCHDILMRTAPALLAVLLAAPAAAQVPVVTLRPFSLPVAACFARPESVPDPERVEPHLPKTVCLDAVSGVLPFSADGALLLEGAPSARASAAGRAGYGVTVPVSVRQAPLALSKVKGGYLASLLLDTTAEDPAGDTGKLTLTFRLDAGGRPVAGTASVWGRVECTFAPVCTDGDVEFPYEDAEPAPR